MDFQVQLPDLSMRIPDCVDTQAVPPFEEMFASIEAKLSKMEQDGAASEKRSRRHNWRLGIVCALLGAIFAAAITFVAMRFFGLQL
jgi:hypothetical protein